MFALGKILPLRVVKYSLLCVFAKQKSNTFEIASESRYFKSKLDSHNSKKTLKSNSYQQFCFICQIPYVLSEPSIIIYDYSKINLTV